MESPDALGKACRGASGLVGHLFVSCERPVGAGCLGCFRARVPARRLAVVPSEIGDAIYEHVLEAEEKLREFKRDSFNSPRPDDEHIIHEPQSGDNVAHAWAYLDPIIFSDTCLSNSAEKVFQKVGQEH